LRPLPTPADDRRFERLFWGPEGVYEIYRRRGWQGSIAAFGSRRPWRFPAFGHQWTLFFGATLWSRSLELGIGLSPDKALKERESSRLQAAGFYADLSALFRRWGFNRSSVSPGGGMWCRRKVSRPSEISRAQQIFESLDVNASPEKPTERGSGDHQRRFEEFLRWMRRSRSRGWRAGFVEFRVASASRAAGIRWRTRFDLCVGPVNSCSWFYAWPPSGFRRDDWRRLERTGFFGQATRELKALGFVGHWRPGLLSDPDRLAAEFWKPTQDPRMTRKDFESLLRCRLPSRG